MAKTPKLDACLAEKHKSFANSISLVRLIAEKMALNCNEALSSKLPYAEPQILAHDSHTSRKHATFQVSAKFEPAFSAFSYSLPHGLASRLACQADLIAGAVDMTVGNMSRRRTIQLSIRHLVRGDQDVVGQAEAIAVLIFMQFFPLQFVVSMLLLLAPLAAPLLGRRGRNTIKAACYALGTTVAGAYTVFGLMGFGAQKPFFA